MSCNKDKFLQDLPQHKWFPPINICDCPRQDDLPEFNGQRKVILEKNGQLRVNHCGRPEKYNLLNQDSFLTENTIYVVQYDFDLNGEIIRIPKNCTLVFYGGSIANGTVLLDETSVYPILDLDKYLFCRISGTYKKGQIKSDENGIYYWNGEEWIKASSGKDSGDSEIIPGKEYKGGIGIIVDNDTINLKTAGVFNLGGIRTNYTEQGENHAVKVDEDGNAYVTVPNSGEQILSYKAYAFKRSDSKPEGIITGGNYDDPVPIGWSKSIPEGTEKVWVTTNTFYSNYTSDSWSPAVLLADSPEMDVCFSSREQPSEPTTHGIQTGEWHNDAQEEDIWMALSLYSMGKWGPWQIIKIQGKQGPPGNNGNDGKSIKVVGNYLDSEHLLRYKEDGSSIFDNQYFNINNVVPSNIRISVGDSLRIIGGTYNEHLMYCMDDSPYFVWMDLGKVEGVATYVHIKFSDDRENFTDNNGDTPGNYIGFLTDNNVEASSNFSDYTWTLFRGNDGYGYWFIYTKDLNPEKLKDLDTYNYYTNGFKYNGSTGNFSDRNIFWNDEFQELQPGEYQYVSFIREPLESGKKWSFPKLWNSYPITYTLKIQNDDEAILDLNKPEGLKQNKQISWKLYINEKEVTNYASYTFRIYLGKNFFGTVREQNTWNLNSVGYGTLKSVITVKAYKEDQFLCSEDLNLPIRGKDGENKESTGFKIVLSNNLGVMPCNLNGTSVIGAQTSTLIQAYYNETKLSSTDFTVLLENNNSQYNASGYAANLQQNQDNYKLTVTRLNRTTSSVPFNVIYNGIVYEKEFEIFKDLDGDSYELEVTPQVVTSESKQVKIQVFKTYDRASNQVVHTEINDLSQYNLKVEYYDSVGDEQILNYIAKNQKFELRGNDKVILKENDIIIDSQYVTYINIEQASQGLSGCVLRYCGIWKAYTDYINDLNYTDEGETDIRWIDYVKYGNNFYLVAPTTEGNGQRITQSEPTDENVGPGKDWIKAEKMDFAYIQTLISDYISTTSLQAHQILITRDITNGSNITTNIVAGIHQGNQNLDPSENTILWSGSTITKNELDDTESLNVSEAPFQVREDGTLIAKKAEIVGDVQANSFTTGKPSDYGIVVLTGEFDPNGKNPNKIYFAFDGTNFNIWFWYNNAWRPMNLQSTLSDSVQISAMSYYTITKTQYGKVAVNSAEIIKDSSKRWPSVADNSFIEVLNDADFLWIGSKVDSPVSEPSLQNNSNTPATYEESSYCIKLKGRVFRRFSIDTTNNKIIYYNEYYILTKDKYQEVSSNGTLTYTSINTQNEYYILSNGGETSYSTPINIYEKNSSNIVMKSFTTTGPAKIISCIYYNGSLSGSGTLFDNDVKVSTVINNRITNIGFA